MKGRGSDQLSDKRQYLQELNSEVRWQISQLTDNLNVIVYGIFRWLCPLANEKHFVAGYPYIYSKDNELYVGEWIYLDMSSLGSYEIINCIKQHGDAIAEHVREEIKEDFTKLVQLTKRLKQYTDIEEGFECDITANLLTLKKFHINKVKLKGGVLLAETDERGWMPIEIPIQPYYEFLEPVIDKLIKVYKDVLRKIKEAEANNKKILKEMDDIIMPYRLARRFSS